MKLNDAIFQTLKTPHEKPAKHKELLESMGYTVEPAHQYWGINGFGFYKDNKVGATVGAKYVSGLNNLKKIDWVNFLATRDERAAKREAMREEGTLYTRILAWRTGKTARRYGWHKDRFEYGNAVMDKYDDLKSDADGYHVEWAKRDVERAEHELELAKDKLKREKEYLENAIKKQREAEELLEAFLQAHGVRKAG